MKSKQKHFKKVHKGKWIPNALTMSRVIIAIAIVVVLLVQPYGWSIDNNERVGIVTIPIIGITKTYGLTECAYESTLYIQFLIAGSLFIIGCLTDFLDGYLSRKYNWISNFGKIMDPVADKVLIDATLIVLCVYNFVYVWIVVLLIARDILVDATRMVKAKEGKVVPANIWGKCKTVFQMLGIMEIMFVFNRIWLIPEYGITIPQDQLGFNEMYNPATAIANIGLYLALFFSLTSGIIYEVQMLKKHKAK